MRAGHPAAGVVMRYEHECRQCEIAREMSRSKIDLHASIEKKLMGRANVNC
jgi:hypothetical protein